MRSTWSVLLPLTLLAGCATSGEMGRLEAIQALGEVGQSARGEDATSSPIEVSTDFTIGAALADAARTVADWWQTEAPCADVSLAENVLTVDYGTLADDCVWNGHTYAGVDTVTVSSTTAGELEVDHDWAGFTNGDVTVDGGAQVTWSGQDQTRRVVTDHTWTANNGGQTVDVHGDHVTGPLEADVPWWQSGFTLEGERDWTGDDGQPWTLTMSGLEWRLIDAVPQTGTVDVTAPTGHTLTIAYARVDENTIAATLSGVRGGDLVFDINQLGIASEE